MDKEKEIEEMSTTIISNADENLISCSLFTAQKISEWLVNAGYGNVKQAVKEFEDKIEEAICEYSTYDGWSVLKILRDCKKELYGGD